jgi:dTDP-4-dehydrorhamnose reductase
LIRELSRGSVPSHPVLSAPGWWHRADRFFCSPVVPTQVSEARARVSPPSTTRPILISGATGTLGKALARVCARRGLEYRLLGRLDLDITDEHSVVKAVDRHSPWALINASGYVRIDEAEHDVQRCHSENAAGPRVLAAVCARMGVPLVAYSSDMVFDGRRDSPYTESDAPAPLNVYGRSKVEAEAFVLSLCPGALVIRTSSFFGPWDSANYVAQVLSALAARRYFHAANDLTVSPTYVPDLVDASLDLLMDGERGIWHLTNECAVTWADFASEAADRAFLDRTFLRHCAHRELRWQAPRPLYSALKSGRSSVMPSLENALDRYFTEREAA